MKVVNLHGIRYLLEGDEDAAFKLIGTGRARMGQMDASRMGRRNMRSRLNMDTGAVVITEMSGRIKHCRIYAPISEDKSLEKEIRRRRLSPAIEIYDEERNFRGLLLSSTSGFNGRWEFIAASRINGLIPFWVGQWRAYESDKPFEGELPDKMFLRERVGDNQERTLTDIACNADAVADFQGSIPGSGEYTQTIGDVETSCASADNDSVNFPYVLSKRAERINLSASSSGSEMSVYPSLGHFNEDYTGVEPIAGPITKRNESSSESRVLVFSDHELYAAETTGVPYGVYSFYDYIFRPEMIVRETIATEIDGDCRVWYPRFDGYGTITLGNVRWKDDNTWYSYGEHWFPDEYSETGVVLDYEIVETWKGEEYKPSNGATMGSLVILDGGDVRGGVVLPVESVDRTRTDTVVNVVGPTGLVDEGDRVVVNTGGFGYTESVWINGQSAEYINKSVSYQAYIDEHFPFVTYPLWTHARYFEAGGRNWFLYSIVRKVWNDPDGDGVMRESETLYTTEYRMVVGTDDGGYSMLEPMVIEDTEEPLDINGVGARWVFDFPDGMYHVAHRFPAGEGTYLKLPPEEGEEEGVEAYGVGRFRLIIDETITR